MELNEQDILRLDEDFKMGLQEIRRHLYKLCEPMDARLCGEWLEKLRTSVNERRIRNSLLRKLIEQVQERRLDYPFNRTPTLGPLRAVYPEEDPTTDWSDAGTVFTMNSGSLESFRQRDQGKYRCGREQYTRKRLKDSKSYHEGLYHNWAKETEHERLEQEKKIQSLTNEVTELKMKNDRITREANNQCCQAKEVKDSLDKLKQEFEQKKKENEKLLSLHADSFQKSLQELRNSVDQNISNMSQRLVKAVQNNSEIQYKLDILMGAINRASQDCLKEKDKEETSKKVVGTRAERPKTKKHRREPKHKEKPQAASKSYALGKERIFHIEQKVKNLERSYKCIINELIAKNKSQRWRISELESELTSLPNNKVIPLPNNT